jgi:hypothetical protein
MAKPPKDIKVAGDYTVGYWRSLRPKLDVNKPNPNAWDEAIKIFRRRIEARFIEPVDVLLTYDDDEAKTFGFAILAIDCLVIETLQAFREGLTNHRSHSKDLFTAFLMDWDVFKKCTEQFGDKKSLARLVYTGYRCELHHSGSTQGAFLVGLDAKEAFAFENTESVVINRTLLHKSLKLEFEKFIERLGDTEERPLRRNFLKKMDAVCCVE